MFSLPLLNLVIKLVGSLFLYLLLFLLEKIFANKFFLVTNSLLTLVVVVIFFIILKTNSFIEPPLPTHLSFNAEQNKLNKQLLSTTEARFVLENNQDIITNQEINSQKYYLNMANLSLLAQDKQKADYFLQIARYINPNTDLVK